MAMTIRVHIVSAEASIFAGVASSVSVSTVSGEIGVLPRHTPLLGRLRPGEVRVHHEGSTEEEIFYVSGGLVEVQPHVVTVLADTALRAADLDEAKAIEAKERAEKLLQDRKTNVDYARIQSELMEAIAQLRTIQKLRKKLKV